MQNSYLVRVFKKQVIMQYIGGNDRDQVFMLSLEGAVNQEAFVRIVNAFFDAIDFKIVGFVNTDCEEEGRLTGWDLELEGCCTDTLFQRRTRKGVL
jgi:hypothetical protein